MVIYASSLIVSSGNNIFREGLSDTILPIVDVIIIIALYYAAQSSIIYGKRTHLAIWTLLISQILWLISDVLWAFFQIGSGFEPTVFFTFIPYTIHVITLSLALLLLPRPKILPLKKFSRIVDIGIVVTIIFLSLWIFIANPLVDLTNSSYAILLLAIGFAILNFSLLYITIYVLISNSGQLMNRPVMYLIIGIFLQLLASSLYSYEALQGQYMSGSLTDFMWILSYLLFGLAAVLYRIQNQPLEIKDCSEKAWYMNLSINPLIPLFSIVIAYFIVIWVYLRVSDIFEAILVAAGFIILLVMIRQLLVLENLKRTKREELKANTKLQENQLKLENSLEEKTVLLKEIHHRVKNNMQIISSLVELESLTAEPKLSEILKDIQGRVMSMALIHEKLYSNNGLSQINLQDYTKTLMNEILQSYDLYSFVKLNLEVDENILLNLDTSVPLGLLLNELITNSLKHGFNGREKGTLSLYTYLDGNNIILTYQDDGKGLPQSFDIDNSTTIGIQLIRGLTEQINGHLTLKSYNPPIFIIKFKNNG